VLEVAVVQRVKVCKGEAGASSAQKQNCSSDKLIVRGKQDIPLVAKNAFGQSLLVPGHDRRSRVLDTAFDPWRKICALEITAKDGSQFIGTGWIAGPRLIITAGHCVFNKTYDGWMESIQVIPGRDGELEPFGRYSSKLLRTMERWSTAGDENYDVGAIILSEDLDDKLGSFTFGFYPEHRLISQMVNISGYPRCTAGEEQMHHSNRICDVTDHKLYYDVDTEGGQSGSPIWFYSDSELDPVVIGVHSNGAGKSLNANSGVRITSVLVDKIAEWRKLE
jgi:V8-like Glu-specific endopeptidase